VFFFVLTLFYIVFDCFLTMFAKNFDKNPRKN